MWLFVVFGFLAFDALGCIRDLLSVRLGCPCAGRHLFSLPPQRK
jgi:hypothetical protein